MSASSLPPPSGPVTAPPERKRVAPPRSLRQAWELLRDSARYRGPLGESLATLPEAAPRSKAGTLPTVVALHGFGGVPFEVDLVGEAASELGLAYEAPLLPGHGLTPSDLAPLRVPDIVSGLRPFFDEVRARGPVILAGLSLGTQLATELALTAPGDVRGLALLANAFWLNRPFPGLFLDWAGALRAPDFGFPKFGADLGDAEAQLSHVSYGIQPTQMALSIQKNGARLAEELHRVHCPTLLLHGALDRVCPVENSWKVAGRLGTRDSRIVVFPRSRHILTRDVERDRVKEELKVFLARFVERP